MYLCVKFTLSPIFCTMLQMCVLTARFTVQSQLLFALIAIEKFRCCFKNTLLRSVTALSAVSASLWEVQNVFTLAGAQLPG